MEKVAGLMMVFIGKTFDSEGRRGGGSWARDTEEWLARKLYNGLDPHIGQATLKLRNAFSEPGSAHQILEILPHSVHLTTDLPYAGTQQEHRPFIKYTPTDVLAMREVVREHLLEAWRAAL